MVIMIVEPDKVQLHILVHMVQKLISTAAIYPFIDSVKAVEFASEHEIDYCFTELQMNRVSGFGLTKAIKEKQKKAQVIAMADTKEYALDAWSCYMNGYLIKPISEGKMKEILKTKKGKGENNYED